MEAAGRGGGQGGRKRRKAKTGDDLQVLQLGKAAIFTSPLTSEESLSDWASLPGDILGLIFRRLPLPNAIRSAAACKRWWLVAEESRDPELPWIWKRSSQEFYSISEDRLYSLDLPKDVLRPGYCMGSYQGWAVMHFRENRKGLNGKCFLFNPFSATRIRLPKISPDNEWWATKVILSAPPNRPHCRGAMFVPANGGGVGFCRVGGKKSEWTMLPQEKKYKDIVFHNQSLYVLSSMGELKLIEIGCSSAETPFRVCIVLPPAQELRGSFKLVECGGELMMFCRFFNSPRRRVGVFSANLRFHRWEMVESLGGRAIIIGHNFCKTVRASKLVGVEEDCVYFLYLYGYVEVLRVSEKRLERKLDSDIWRCPLRDLDTWLTPISWRN